MIFQASPMPDNVSRLHLVLAEGEGDILSGLHSLGQAVDEACEMVATLLHCPGYEAVAHHHCQFFS